MKKLIFTIAAVLALGFSSFGQAPEGFKYQAVVRDAGNTILNNQAVGMQMVIHQGSTTGTAVYSETFATTTNGYGLVNLEIGTGTTSDDFSVIDWSAGPFYIETLTDLTGGTSYSSMGTSQLMSVPYALYAKTSGNGAGPAGPAGATGATGATGVAGPAGTNGVDGAVGATGPIGATGTTGATGPVGPAGATGMTGATGPQGLTGSAGVDGMAGATGPIGPIGATGPAGNDGAVGATGSQGPVGNDGAVGPIGSTGVTGATGPQGLTGPAGVDGMAGATGPIGPIGATGPSGNDGAVGATGSQGPVGNDGAVGPIGATGMTGATGPQGLTGPAGVDGMAGATGPIGPIGATGPAGAGVPVGGTANQVLSKINGTNYNTQWVTPSAGGGSLDDAYNFGGAGVGRWINANSGSVGIIGNDGFYVNASLNSGLAIGAAGGIPSGGGAKMFFNGKKVAFRAGSTSGGQWDDASVGFYSIGLGLNVTASGNYSVAFGNGNTASGIVSTAMGSSTVASGDYSTAFGNLTTASGSYSIAAGVNSIASGYASNAFGWYALASGSFSTTLGNNVSTNMMDGSFIIGDNSTTTSTNSTAINSMTMRFNGGYRLFSNSALTTGVTLANGGGAWASVSDRNKKENFTELDLETILQKVTSMPVTSWNYIGVDSTVVHVGPMAQDFYAAFGLSNNGVDSDKSITTSDIDGINMAAIQALALRTEELQKTSAELQKTVAELELLKNSMDNLEQSNASMSSEIEAIRLLIADMFGTASTTK